MEDKFVSFGKGIHREPSLGAVGELSECVNMYGKNGEMRMLPRLRENTSSDKLTTDLQKAIYLHNVDNRKIVIVLNKIDKSETVWNRVTKWSSLKVGDEIKYKDESGEVVVDNIAEVYLGESGYWYIKTSSGEDVLADKYDIVFKKETVVTGASALYWGDMDGYQIDFADPVNIMTFEEGESVNDITSIGNVLVVATSVKMYYFLWTEGTYVDYSLDKIGDMDIQFSLKGDYEMYLSDSVKIINIDGDDSKIEHDKAMLTWNYSGDYQCDRTKSYAELLGGSSFSNGESYYVEVDEGTEAFSIGIFALKEGYTMSNLNIRNGDPNDDTDIYIQDNTWYSYDSSNKAIHVTDKGKEKFEVLYIERANNNGSFVPKTGSYTRVFFVVSSKAYRNLNVRIYGKADYASSYSYAIDKTNNAEVDIFRGAINKFIKTYATDKERFMYPFFVRYAIRLKDGSYIKPSSPVLMVPNSGCVPNCYVNTEITDDSRNSMVLSACCCDLEYKICNDSDFMTNLNSRSELIDGISIAVTMPNYTFDTEATDKDFNEYMYLDASNIYGEGSSLCSVNNIPSNYVGLWGKKYVCRPEKKLAENVANINAKYRVTLPVPKHFNKKLVENSTFYVIADISLDKLSNGVRNTVEIASGTLDSLAARKRMDDNCISLAGINAKTAYVYNNRLTLGNLNKELFRGYNPSNMQGCIENAVVSRTATGAVAGSVDNKYARTIIAVVTISKNNKEYKVAKVCKGYSLSKVSWFYYPDADAKNVELFVEDVYNSSSKIYSYLALELEKHPVLNGVYWIGTIDNVQWDSTNESKFKSAYESAYNKYSSSGEVYVTEKNKVLSSIVNNPFVIDEDSASLIGMGEVQKLISNTKALSQGQFGQHPVLAFCTDGIWALSVGSDGTYSAVQPISRDVVKEGAVKSITQLDDAIVFVTEKGLMMLNGSSIVRIDEQMDNKREFALSKIAEVTGLSGIDVLEADGREWKDILDDCVIAYDYVHQLLWLHDTEGVTSGTGANATKSLVSYVVDLKTKEVYQHVSNDQGIRKVVAVLRDYPVSYVQATVESTNASGAKVVYDRLMCYDGDDAEVHSGWFVTRAIPFDDAYSMKMLYDLKVEKLLMDDLNQSGEPTDTTQKSVKVTVWASNDRVHWCRLTSLKGRSFKWYRFGVRCNMNDYDRVTGMVCRIDKRRGNKIR